ncbi:MAG TPA: ADOP family duplicated permease [Vicinamibacterales bacterium]|nr:ADOP family duplicated permease [Vicinamibacterales bacterium]
MTTLRVLVNRCLEFLLRRRRDARLSEEIQVHLDLLTDEYAARGLPPDDARRAARRAFGGVDRVTADYRYQRGLPALDGLLQDVRFAGRLLGRDPGFTLAAVAVLAVGIGVNNMLFTIVNAHTLRGLPIEDVGRVVSLSTFDEQNRAGGVSFLDFVDWRLETRSFTQMAAYTSAPVVVAEDGRAPERLDATFVSASAFPLIGTQPTLGRGFATHDDMAGSAPVAILSSRLWMSRYGQDPHVLGRVVSIDGLEAVVVGVVPERSGFPATPQIWLPLSRIAGLRDRARDARSLQSIARLRNDAGLEAARAELEAVASRLAAEHPATNRGVRVRVAPVNEQVLGRMSDPAWAAFMATGVLVVLISCANAANLVMGRAVERSREIAIRAALGAGRWRMTRQMLVEGAILAALGGAAGLALAIAGVRLFRSAIPPQALPYWVDYTPDGRVLAALVAVTAATVFLFALFPAVQAARTDVNATLTEGLRSGLERRGKWSTGFLAAEFGLAVILLSHFVVNVRTAQSPLATDDAIRTSEVLTAAVTLPPARYDTAERRAAFYSELLERLGRMPGLESVALASSAPLLGAAEQRLYVPHMRAPDRNRQATTATVSVTPGYFSVFGLALVRGRDFAADDGAPGRGHVIVNERFAEVFAGGPDWIGQSLAVVPDDGPEPSSWLTVVGVAPSIRHRSNRGAEPVVYLPFRAEAAPSATLLVRSPMDTDALVGLLRREVQALDSALPLYRTRTMRQAIAEATWVPRLSNDLFQTLTLIAVFLATAGLYAVTAHGVSQRKREIGVRLALGARPRHVIQLVARRVAWQLALGFAAGIACTRVWGWMFSTGRADVTPTDPASLVAVAGILAAVAALASLLPARRAARLDPVDAIRCG